MGDAARLALIAAGSFASAAGIAFLALGLPPSRPPAQRFTLAAYLSIGFLLVNWWPHMWLRELVAVQPASRPLLRQAIYAIHDLFMVAAAVIALFVARQLFAFRPSGSTQEWSRRSRWPFVAFAVAIAVVSIPVTSGVYAVLRLPTAAAPPTWLLPGLLLNTAITRLALGTGIAYLVWVARAARRSRAASGRSLLGAVSVGWCLISWLPYQQIDYLISPAGPQQLALGYGFHLPLILASAVLAALVLVVTPDASPRSSPLAVAAPGAAR